MRLALVLAGAAACTSGGAVTAAEVLRTTITVRVYQTAGLPSTFEQRALAEAETLLRAALVDVRWQKCGRNASPACSVPAGPSQLLLRVMRERVPRQATPAPLGHALLDHWAGGVLATVYFDRVAWLASVAGTDAAVLLGRVTAHELGHLLMGTPAHSRHGLMRPRWTDDEVRRNRVADWVFTSGDMAAMREMAPEN